MSSVRNLVSVVTGAGSGLGRGIALMMGQRGALVGVADLAGESAERTVHEITTAGGKAVAVEMDVTSEQAVQDNVQKVVDHFGTGRLDVMVANAGFQHIAPVSEFPFDMWKKMLAVHMDGSFLCTREALKHMAVPGADKRSGGSIIYMGSIHSKEASVLKAPYVAAKHGLLGLCRAVAKEGASIGVRTNIVCPGFVRTPLVDAQIPQQAKSLGISEQQVIENLLRPTVDGEFSTVEDVAETTCFLAGFPTNALTGQSINVSHGWNMT